MLTQDFEILIIAALTAFAASLPGVYLIHRRLSLMSDAIGHAILLGIVGVFFVTKDPSSPFQILGAALAGMLLVFVAQFLWKTNLVKTETAIGLVFPLMFSVGVVLISLFADNVHLDLDSVILGELAFAPFNRFEWLSFSVPKSLVIIAVISALNLGFVLLFYKELKLSTFDEAFFGVMGFSSSILNYGLMMVLSVTAVGSFEAVGSILVVALFVVPPSAAMFFSEKLGRQLVISCAVGILGSVAGYSFALWLDLSIAGSIAAAMGILFLLVFLLHPRRGLIPKRLVKIGSGFSWELKLILVHVSQHQHGETLAGQCNRGEIHRYLNCDRNKVGQALNQALKTNLIRINETGNIRLTEEGRKWTAEAMTH